MTWGDCAVSLPVRVPVNTQPQGQILHDEHLGRTRACTRAHAHTVGVHDSTGHSRPLRGQWGVGTIVLACVQGEESRALAFLSFCSRGVSA